MPGDILNISSTVMCMHGGSAILTTANTKVMVDNVPALLESDVHSVAGCPFQIPIGTGTKPSPCIRIEWSAGSTKMQVNGAGVLVQKQHRQVLQPGGSDAGHGQHREHANESQRAMNPNNGRHLAFPFRIGANGRAVQVSTLEDHVRDELMQLILTNPGERLFLPEFGGGVRRLVFETNDETTTGAMVKATLTSAVSKWLGNRITLEELRVDIENEKIEVDLKYRIAGTQDARVLRFQRKGG